MFNFDLHNGYVILRIICGLFFAPHALGKITAKVPVFGFFTAAGLKPPQYFVYPALVAEVIFAICLVLGIYTHYAALVAAIFLAVAVLAVLRVTKGKWLWNLGGCEYPVFWMICCIIVAMNPT